MINSGIFFFTTEIWVLVTLGKASSPAVSKSEPCFFPKGWKWINCLNALHTKLAYKVRRQFTSSFVALFGRCVCWLLSRNTFLVPTFIFNSLVKWPLVFLIYWILYFLHFNAAHFLSLRHPRRCSICNIFSTPKSMLDWEIKALCVSACKVTSCLWTRELLTLNIILKMQRQAQKPSSTLKLALISQRKQWQRVFPFFSFIQIPRVHCNRLTWK